MKRESKKVSWLSFRASKKLAAQKAAKVDKSETSKAAKVVRPSDKIAASAKKAVEEKKSTTGKLHKCWFCKSSCSAKCNKGAASS